MSDDYQHDTTRRRYGKGVAGALGVFMGVPGATGASRTSSSSRRTGTAQAETSTDTPQTEETAPEAASDPECEPTADSSPAVSPDELPPEFADIHDDLEYALDQAITDYNSTHGTWENPHLDEGSVEWEFSKAFSGAGKSDHYMLDVTVTTNPDGKYGDITAHAGHQERGAMIDELGDFYGNVIANTIQYLDGFGEDSQTTDEPVIQDLQYVVDGGSGGKIVTTYYPAHIDHLAAELRQQPPAKREAYAEEHGIVNLHVAIEPPPKPGPC